MANNLKKIYVGAICNRDLEVMNNIQRFMLTNHNISIIDLSKNNSHHFDEKDFKRKLKRYPLSYLIVKLTTHASNQKIYEAVKKYASHIPILNNLESVKTCESRKDTFWFIKNNCKNLKVPQFLCNYSQAYNAICNGMELIIKYDAHNIPNFPKEDRVVGIARSESDFLNLTDNLNKDSLFFQEYLGNHDLIYKIYVIGQWYVSITSQNRLLPKERFSPLELIHMRVPIEKEFKRKIKRLSRKMGMNVFGIDYLKTVDGPYVVDVNDFPSFRSIPEGISLISDHVYNTITMREQIYKSLMKVKS
jgi:glutathione synthase/RimK-type ligase-like ATP-grasp enzyme